MATRDLTRDGTAETKRSGVYTPRNVADEVDTQKSVSFCGSDERSAVVSLNTSSVACRRQLPLKGKPLFPEACDLPV